MGKYHVVVTFVEAGIGHISTASAIADALETYYPDLIDVERSYVLRETEDPVLLQHEKNLVDVVKKSNRNRAEFVILMALQRALRRFSLVLCYSTVYRKAKQHLTDLILRKNPDMLVNTHFTPHHCAIEAKLHGADIQSAVYVPDPCMYAWWDKKSELLFTNNDYAYKEALKYGFRAENIVQAKFIMRKQVTEAVRDPLQMRKKHGLPETSFTVLITSGAYAEGHLSEYSDAILAMNLPMTLLVVAGTNETVYRKYAEIAESGTYPNVRLFVYRFLSDIHEYYCASDVVVTKAGPNAILDSVYMGTPVITNFYSGPVEHTTKKIYIDQHHVGVHADSTEACCRQIREWMEHPETLNDYRKNCKTFVDTCTGGEKIIADAIADALVKHGPPKADR